MTLVTWNTRHNPNGILVLKHGSLLDAQAFNLRAASYTSDFSPPCKLPTPTTCTFGAATGRRPAPKCRMPAGAALCRSGLGANIDHRRTDRWTDGRFAVNRFLRIKNQNMDYGYTTSYMILFLNLSTGFNQFFLTRDWQWEFFWRKSAVFLAHDNISSSSYKIFLRWESKNGSVFLRKCVFCKLHYLQAQNTLKLLVFFKKICTCPS